MGEHLQPALDEGGGHGLGTDVHQPPLGKLIIFQLHIPALDGVQHVLGPGHQQPYDGAFFIAGSFQHPFRLGALEQHRLAAHHEAAEPVHLGTGMVQRRNAQEHIVVGLSVVGLLRFHGVGEAAVQVQNGLGEAGGAGGIIDGTGVVVRQRHFGIVGGAEGDHLVIAVRKGGAVFPHIKEVFHLGNAVADFFHTADEFRAEDEHGAVRLIQAVLDFICGIAVVERHRHGAGTQGTEIHRQPFQAVHQKDSHLVAFFQAAGEQQIGEAVGFFLKFLPGNFPAEGFARLGLHEGIFPPGDAAFGFKAGVDLHQRHFIGVELCIFC